jgi:hypothetical protein
MVGWACTECGVVVASETAALLRANAARCRRLADSTPNQNDPVVSALLTMADELDALADADEQPADDDS